MKYTILLPASKSLSNRALIINALTDSPLPLNNLSDCDDTKVMREAFIANAPVIDIGAAGTAMRFLTAYFAGKEAVVTLTGTDRMKKRPIKPLVDALCSLGAKIEYVDNEGFPPLRIYGKTLSGGKVALDGGLSSQYISALMMMAPLMTNGLEVCLSGNIVSRPYIEMTLKMMAHFGVETEWKENNIIIKPQRYKAREFTVESDWSAASYWYEIAALMQETNTFILTGLTANSWQGDSKIAAIFGLLGIESRFVSKGVEIRHNRGASLPPFFEYDFTDIPDLAQTLVVTMCCLGIKFRFTGLQSLRIKETDRIAALQHEMKKLGYLLKDSDDSVLEWNGKICEKEKCPVISTYHDHRMAMSFAPAGLLIKGLTIENKDVVSKSYPQFWEEFNKI
jgi:3-phosphoshikimate 1-carboxyvinyltransferase